MRSEYKNKNTREFRMVFKCGSAFWKLHGVAEENHESPDVRKLKKTGVFNWEANPESRQAP